MKKIVLPICFLILTFLSYPLNLLRSFDTTNSIRYWSELQFITLPFLGAFSLVVILLSYEKLKSFIKNHKITTFLIIGWSLIAILQQAFIFFSPINFLGMMSYVTIPLFVYFYKREFKLIFPYYLLVIFVLSIFTYLSELKYHPNAVSGFAGNWNWSATIFIISLCSIFYLIKEKNKKLFFIFIVVTLLTLIPLHYIAQNPKATFLATFLAILSLFIIRFKDKLMWRTIFIAMGIFIMLCVIALLNPKEWKVFTDDIRVQLCLSGLNVGFLNPFIGCGFDYFASAVKPLLSENYFLNPHAAVFNPHPHNEIIFAFASFGFIGLIYWGFIIYLGVKQIFACRKSGKLHDYLLLFIYIVFVIHGMLDLVIFMFPGNIIFLILIGLMNSSTISEEHNLNQKREPWKFVAITFAIIIGLTAINSLKSNTLAHYYFYKYRLLEDNSINKKVELLEKSREYLPTPDTLYSLALIKLQTQKPAETILLLNEIPELTNFENFNRNHHLLALAYLQTNNTQQALIELEKEYNNHPLSIINLYVFYDVLNKLKREDEANYVKKLLSDALKVRGKPLEYFLNNPNEDI